MKSNLDAKVGNQSLLSTLQSVEGQSEDKAERVMSIKAEQTDCYRVSKEEMTKTAQTNEILKG